MEKIAVIVPVYNGEKYIKQCIDTILTQSYTNIEVIIVNDGSTDDTLKIINEYKVWRNVRIITQEHRGVSVARNNALKEISANYVTFIDSDDYIDNNYIKMLYKTMKDYNVDMVIQSYNVVYLQENKIYKYKYKVEGLYSGQEIARKLIEEEEINNFAWGKLIKTSILKQENILFPENIKIYEDRATLFKIAYNCTKVMISNDTRYYYVQHTNNTTARNDIEYLYDSLKVLEEMKKYIDSYKIYETVKKEFYHLALKNLYVVIEKIDSQRLPLKKEFFVNWTTQILDIDKLLPTHIKCSYLKKYIERRLIILISCKPLYMLQYEITRILKHFILKNKKIRRILRKLKFYIKHIKKNYE